MSVSNTSAFTVGPIDHHSAVTKGDFGGTGYLLGGKIDLASEIGGFRGRPQAVGFNKVTLRKLVASPYAGKCA